MPFALLQQLSSSLIWRIPSNRKVIHLTFDDGPIPVVTPWVLDQLAVHGAKATFFCVGSNVKKNANIYQRILEEGHRTGNHTDKHVNGWTMLNREYYLDIAKCARVVKSDLFRPPYGKIRPTQIARIRKEYKVIMWDVLSKDYDTDMDGKTCAERVIKSSRPGSIIVFHDSVKAEPRLRIALPEVLEYFRNEGYSFETLPC